jgi:hypothetical protein
MIADGKGGRGKNERDVRDALFLREERSCYF